MLCGPEDQSGHERSEEKSPPLRHPELNPSRPARSQAPCGLRHLTHTDPLDQNKTVHSNFYAKDTLQPRVLCLHIWICNEMRNSINFENNDSFSWMLHNYNEDWYNWTENLHINEETWWIWVLPWREQLKTMTRSHLLASPSLLLAHCNTKHNAEQWRPKLTFNYQTCNFIHSSNLENNT